MTYFVNYFAFYSKDSTLNPDWFYAKCEAFCAGDPDPYFFDFVSIE